MQSVSPRDHPCPDGGIGRRAGLKIQCPLKTCGFEPRSGHAKKTACGGLFWCPNGPFYPPPLRGCPRGGDWRKTPRPPPVSISFCRWRFSIYRPSYLRSRAHGRLHITPTPNLSPEPREIEHVQISEASRKERPQVLIPPLGGETRRQKPPPACPDGPYHLAPPKVAAPCSRGSAHGNS